MNKKFDNRNKNKNKGDFSKEYKKDGLAKRKPYNDGRRNEGFDEELSNGSVPGRNAVRELLKSGRAIEKIYVREGEREGSITVLAAMALERGIPLIETDKAKLDRLCGFEQHQGIVAIASEKEYVEIEDVLKIAEERAEKPLIVIADNVSDPHNLGAIIRCAEGAKASAGAVEHLAAVKCTNITDTIKKLKEYGLWIIAAEADGQDYTKIDFNVPCAIVLGSEEHGVSELVRKNCDFVASLPMRGQVNSLNVSTASAVLLYEAIKQRGYK